MTTSTQTTTQFGRGLRTQFLFDETYLNLNHGSFGTYPRVIRDILRSYQDQAEAAPDTFIRYEYPKLLDRAREALGQVLNAPTETIVLVPNATTGINTVLRSMVFNPNDVIVYFGTIYGSCEKTVEYITETTPAKAVKIEYTLPVEDDWLVDQFVQSVKKEQAKGNTVRIAIIDTVSSMPGARMPFESLTRSCRNLGVLSCIDAAHGLGHVELDLTDLDPDFFVSNVHKWFFVPRGCAVLYVPVRNQDLIKSTLPTSHGFIPKPKPGVDPIINPLPSSLNTPFVENFKFVGTVDNSNYLCIPAALEYRAALGGEAAIRQYCWQLAQEGGRCVADALGTEVLENSTKTLGNCCMSNVRLPISLQQVMQFAPNKSKAEVGRLVRDWMTLCMVEEFRTFMAMIFYGGAWWVRLSGQIYLDIADFEWAAGVLAKLCDRVLAGEFVPAARPSKL